MELRHMRCAVALADTLHFGRAAKRLGIAQPPLSQQIKSLEEELGVRLFERSSRQVALTLAGEAFIGEARAILSKVERATLAARATGRGEAGQLMIGLVGSAAAATLPTLIRAFRRRHPGVELRLRELPTASQAEQLLIGELDAGLLRPPLAGKAAARLSLKPLEKEALLAVLPSDHRLAGRSSIPVSLLAGEDFVLFPRQAGPGLYDQVTSLCRRGGFVPAVAQEAVQMQTIAGLVAAGLGVSLVPASVARLTRPDVRFVPVTPRVHASTLSLAWRTGDTSPLVDNLVRLARDLFRAAQ
ncbi:LysR family transcriptional regulator [Nonomuraea diastatica]|uniref:LysR family transcriptional regulator n=2 Tax=Nonomuraea diastatica TaxID=1848329 RepID=A0A4R4WIZ9_9ACTN|nr:LysR family transcriptional regulator [Nonomuraea diastatica]